MRITLALLSRGCRWRYHAVALQGWASTELPENKERPEGASLAPLLDTITRLVPAPTGLLDADTKVRCLASCIVGCMVWQRRDLSRA